jgi:membrane-associated phospholipid phosphatase
MAHRITSALLGERHALACVLVLMSVNLLAFGIFPNGYDAAWTVITMQTCALIWVFGLAMRTAFPDVRGLYVFESVALTTTVGIQAALATATLAPMGGDYADGMLATADTILVPFVTWPQAVGWLVEHPALFRFSNHVYTSVNWQAPLLIVLLALTGGGRTLRVLTLAAGLSAIIGLAIFALMPAQGAYVHHGFERSDLPDLMVGLPFDYPVVLNALRDGTMDTLSSASVSGLISFPSFHAASAVMLSIAWARFGRIAIPMHVLNAGVALSAIPIGSHYFTDILGGVAVGFFSMKASSRLTREPEPSRASARAITPPTSGQGFTTCMRRT